MGGSDDHRHAPGHMFERQPGERFALVVGQQELLGKVGQDAQAVDAGINHEVDAALLARQIERAVFVERRRHDREDAAVAGVGKSGHGVLLIR
ncbi:hypothetical protein D3C85_1513240 [compost metagenome]